MLQNYNLAISLIFAVLELHEFVALTHGCKLASFYR